MAEHGGTYLTLDDIALRTQALADPQGFVEARRDFTVLDEVQLAPELLRAVKLTVDRDRRPGRFLLTGSQNLLRLRNVTETLAGRSAWVELGPFTWSEIAERPLPSSLDDAFGARDADQFLKTLRIPLPEHAAAARARAIRGGMPPTLPLSDAQRRAWYEGYRKTFLERDLRQLSDIENLPEFSRLLSLAALRSATLLNKSALAAEAGLTHPTLRRYLGILEIAYQFFELPPFHANLGKRLVKAPKLYAYDSGLVAHLGGIETFDEAMSYGRGGPIFETWAIGEILSVDRFSERSSTASFFRTSTGREVDLVLDRGANVAAIEIKAAGTVSHEDTLGLRELSSGLGKRFKLGIVAHLGRTMAALAPKICAVPLASLLGITEADSASTSQRAASPVNRGRRR